MGTLVGKVAGGPVTYRGVCGANGYSPSLLCLCTAWSTFHAVTFHLWTTLYRRDNRGPAQVLHLPKVTQPEVKPLTCCT